MVIVLGAVNSMRPVMRCFKKGNHKHPPGVFINYLCIVLLSIITLNSEGKARGFFRFC